MRILFAGTPDFAVTTLKALLDSQHEVVAVLTQPDKPTGRGKTLTAPPVKQAALAAGCEVLQPASLKSEAVQNRLAAYQPDLMVVAVYGLILPSAVLAMPRLGCLNVHASLLPRWRGASPIQQALLAGDQETGITLMKMDAGLDTGDMLEKVPLPISATDTTGTLHAKLADIGATTLVAYLAQLEASGATALLGEKQDDALSCHAPKISKQLACVDWQQSATQIERAIRAYQPWPICYSHLNQQTVRFWAAEVCAQTENATFTPGTIVQASKLGLDIQTGQDLLRVKTLQLPGKKPQSVVDVLNGHAKRFAPMAVFKPSIR